MIRLSSTLKIYTGLLALVLAAVILCLESNPALAGGSEPAPAATTTDNWQLQAQGRHFVDRSGRKVILRGVNVAGDSKVPPFIPLADVSELDPLKAWGYNVIRLLFTWEAFESTPGQYDWGYLDYITSIADAAWARGMYTIIDIHQDGFSRYQIDGCGDGFPAWAVSPDASLDAPDNSPERCGGWAGKMLLDVDMHASFGDFYANRNGVRDRYLGMLDELARQFASHDGVIGYDLLNEPWGWEATELLPLYEDAAATIRAVDTDAIMFIEGHAGTNNGVIQTTLPKPTFGNFAYAPHFYDAGVFSTKSYLGINTEIDLGFYNMASKANEWNVPLFLGEFGMFNETWNVKGYMDTIYRKLNETLASGTQWNYTPGWTSTLKDGWNGENLSIVDGNGNPQPTFELRPYAQKVSGTPSSLSVSDDGRSIELKWNHVPSTGSTELFVPKTALFGSKKVKIEKEGSGLSCGFDATSTRVTCSSTSSGNMRVKVRECVMIWGTCY